MIDAMIYYLAMVLIGALCAWAWDVGTARLSAMRQTIEQQAVFDTVFAEMMGPDYKGMLSPDYIEYLRKLRQNIRATRPDPDDIGDVVHGDVDSEGYPISTQPGNAEDFVEGCQDMVRAAKGSV